jgi:hypothetical protein
LATFIRSNKLDKEGLTGVAERSWKFAVNISKKRTAGKWRRRVFCRLYSLVGCADDFSPYGIQNDSEFDETSELVANIRRRRLEWLRHIFGMDETGVARRIF